MSETQPSEKFEFVDISKFTELKADRIGGLIGGALGNAMDVPQNIWWLREFMKLGVTILSMYTIQNIFKWNLAR